jgi:hypothetical protein
MNRTAPQTPLSRNLILDLYNARDELVGGQGINAVTRPGTYAYDDVVITNPPPAPPSGGILTEILVADGLEDLVIIGEAVLTQSQATL